MNHPASVLRVACPLCASKMSASASQIGHTITCDTCLEEFVVEAPGGDRSGPAEEAPAAAPHSPAEAASPDGGALLPAPADSPDPLAAPGDSAPAPAAGGEDQQSLRLDDDLTAEDFDAPRPKAPPALDADYEFSVECPLCGTRQSASDRQIGQTIQCPDCHSRFEIRTPPPRLRRPRHARPDGDQGRGDDEDDEFRLSPAIEPPRYEPLLEDPYAGPRESAPPAADKATDRHRQRTLDALQRAEEEVQREQEEAAQLPAWPLTSGTLAFFVDPAALFRLGVVAVALQIEISAVTAARDMFSSTNPITQFVSMGLIAFSLVFGVFTFGVTSVALLAITQDTATGKDRIENWPNVNFLDWFLDAFYVIAALFVAIVAGILLGQVFWVFGINVLAQGLTATCLVSVIVLFPVLLLGMLETGSPINPVSGPVMRSLRLAAGYWIQFFLISLVLTVAAIVLSKLRGFESTPLDFITSAATMTLVFIYFRVLGRLAWVCQEAVGRADRERLDDVDEDENGALARS